MDDDRQELERRADTGDAAAQNALARLHQNDGRHQLARGWFARAAQNGAASALRELALNLLSYEPVAAYDGVNMLRAAAEQGDTQALLACSAIAANDVDLPDRFGVALDLLRRAGKAGSAPAQEQLALLSATDGIDVPSWTSARPQHVRFEDPRICTIADCAPAGACDWLMQQAKARLNPARVYDEVTGGGRHEHGRSNSSAEFTGPQSNVILALIRARIAATADLPLRGLDDASILHYSVGQEFVPHTDFLDAQVPAFARDIANRGQRAATFLLYLNDDYDGAETRFLDLEWGYKGKKGDALLFWNVDAQGKPHPRTRHAGTAPTRGEKWVLSQWLRQPAI